MNKIMKIRELQRRITAEIRESDKLPDQSSEKVPLVSISPDLSPLLFTSSNITFRRHDSRKMNSKIKIGSINNFTQQAHPVNVNFQKLPFYRVLTELVKPSSLIADYSGSGNGKNTFQFYLTSQQIENISSSQINDYKSNKLDYVIQVQMRFGLQEEDIEQEDYIPPGVTAKVNGRSCYIPYNSKSVPGDLKAKKKIQMKPVDITTLVKLTPVEFNQVEIICPPDFGKRYVVGIFLVRKVTSYELTNQLKIYKVKESKDTRRWIVDKLNEDLNCEIATTSLRVSLACPLGKMRMSAPCRSSSCTHLQCFDARSYLQMNELRPLWNCPVCNKYAPLDSLVVDGYFREVLDSGKLMEDENEIQLLPDGAWKVLITGDKDFDKKTKEMRIRSYSGGKKSPKEAIKERDVFSISSDEEDKQIPVLPFKKRKVESFDNEVIVVDLD